MARPTEPAPITVFVSSPSDLIAERRLAREVIERLSGGEFGGRRVRLVPLLWEDDVPAITGDPAQLAVDYYMGRAAETDVYVGIFWTKIGSPAVIGERRHESGTLYEFQQGYASFKRTGRPKMLLYRCVRPAPTDRENQQLAKVEEFFSRFRGEHPQFEGLPRQFVDGEEFVRHLERDLRLVLERLGQASPGGEPQGPASSGKRARGHAVLVQSVQAFLSNFEDLFGDGREREAWFPVRFRALPDPARPDRPAPDGALPAPNSSLLDLYERWGRRTLLLGQAGAGKTFALLILMQELIDRARRTGSGSIPVYFDLSSWVLTRSSASRGKGPGAWWRRLLQPQSLQASPTLDPWLVDELVRRYSIPRKAAHKLIYDRQIIFCFDGLDELKPGEADDRENARPEEAIQLRAECVETINNTLDDRSVQMILCCRDQTFRELPVKPRLGRPLQVQPLTEEDGKRYLAEWANLDGLRGAMAESALLREKASAPLFLRLMAVSYKQMEKQAILDAAEQPEAEWETHLLDNFVRQCIAVAPLSSPAYTKDQIPRCLGWIARRQENDFLVEDMQPSLLRVGGRGGEWVWHRAYRRLSVGMLAVLLTLAAAVPSGLAIGIEWGALESPWAGVGHGLLVAGVDAAITFPFGLAAFAAKRWWAFALLLGIPFGLVRGIDVALSPPGGVGGSVWDGLLSAAATIPCAAIIFMLMGHQMLGKIEGHKRRYRNRPGIEQFEIQPLETFDWRWFDRTSYWRGGWIGLLVGPIVGVLFWKLFGPARGASFFLITTAFVTMFSGLSNTGVRISLGPNQGIERSLRNALLMTGLFTLVGVVSVGVSYWTSYGPMEGVVNICLALTLTFVFLVFGGLPVVRHACLGQMLHLQGKLPSWICWPPWRHTIAFLDDMVRYKLLRRSAGGYMFRHETLRQYYLRGRA
jgi:hypothetical protein